MTLLHQPLSRKFGQRDGCLTPSGSDDRKSLAIKTNLPTLTDSSLSSAHEILSPPLSPYRRESASFFASDDLAAPKRRYLASNHPFKVEDFKNYSMTVNAWSGLDKNYKEKQLRFLSQYSFDNSISALHLARPERRAERKRPSAPQHSSDSDSESVDRVRTRRVVKENHVALLGTESSDQPVTPPHKKRKVRKEMPYAGSPLAAQQAALIDETIPDYSPDPYTTLPKGNLKALKIEWKGQAMDLKNDPNIDKLHPAEVLLASTLRLRCNVYLDSKRRLFFEKVKRVRGDMPFRRTDAQKACRIDVNKASRLFAAFEKVGWLNDEHFAAYL